MRTIFVTLCIICFNSLGSPAAAIGQSSVATRGLREVESPSKWSGNVNLGAFRGSDEFSSPVYQLNFGVSYNLSRKQAFESGFGYWQPSEADSDKMYHYGFRDSTLGYRFKDAASFSNGISIEAGIGLTLPTSEVSQRASLIGSLVPALSVKYPLWGQFLVATSDHSVSYSLFRYDAPSSTSLNYNVPWIVGNGLGLAATAHVFSLSAGYQHAHLVDFAGTEVNVQTFVTGFKTKVSANSSLSIFARWSDHTVTDNSLFDSDTRTVGVSAVVSL